MVLLALLARVPSLPAAAPTPTVEVTLTRPDASHAPPAARRPATHQTRLARPASAPPPLETIPAIGPTAIVAAPTAPSPNDAQLRAALQSALGCRESAYLTPEQRRACQDRQAQAFAARAAKSYGMDPARRAAFAEEAREREPFLARTPKDNCVPRVQEKEVGRGATATHDWKAGFACAKAF